MTSEIQTLLYAVGVLSGFFLLIFGAVMLIRSKTKQQKILEQYKNEQNSTSTLTKKYPESDVRNYTPSLFLYGAVLSLGLCIAILSYTTYQQNLVELGTFSEEEVIPIDIQPTRHQPPPPPPPPPIEVKLVDDNKILKEEPKLIDVEVGEKDVIVAPDLEIETEVVEPEILIFAEEMPRFPGCEDGASKREKKRCAELALMNYLSKVEYPDFARDNDIQGKVIIQFVVDTDGSIRDLTVLKGAHKTLEDAAIKHLKRMPKWIPGKQRGKPAKVYFRAPFRFRLG